MDFGSLRKEIRSFKRGMDEKNGWMGGWVENVSLSLWRRNLKQPHETQHLDLRDADTYV